MIINNNNLENNSFYFQNSINSSLYFQIMYKITNNQNLIDINQKYLEIIKIELNDLNNSKNKLKINLKLFFTVLIKFLILNDKKSFYIDRKKMIQGVKFSYNEFRFLKPESFIFNINRSISIERNLKKSLYYLILIKEIIFSLNNNVSLEKREIYYNNIKTFESMDILHKSIQEISFLIGIPRRFLNIFSSATGLYSGKIIFSKKIIVNTQKSKMKNNNYQHNNMILSNQTTQLSQSYQSLFYSPSNLSQKTQEKSYSSGLISKDLFPLSTEAGFLFIVEKETVFHHLLENGFHSLFPKSILITGKGYPDYLTKQFIQNIIIINPKIAVFYIGDMDPHGIGILIDYLIGNEITVYENLFCTIIFPLGMFQEDCENLNGFIKLEIEDINKIHQLLGLKIFE